MRSWFLCWSAQKEAAVIWTWLPSVFICWQSVAVPWGTQFGLSQLRVEVRSSSSSCLWKHSSHGKYSCIALHHCLCTCCCNIHHYHCNNWWSNGTHTDTLVWQLPWTPRGSTDCPKNLRWARELCWLLERESPLCISLEKDRGLQVDERVLNNLIIVQVDWTWIFLFI